MCCPVGICYIDGAEQLRFMKAFALDFRSLCIRVFNFRDVLIAEGLSKVIAVNLEAMKIINSKNII